MAILKAIFKLIRETAVSYGQDKGGLMAAALAYHTIFSLAPLLVIAVALAGFVFGQAASQDLLVGQIEHVVGREAAVVIQNLIQNASQGSSGVVATVASTALLVYGASGVFNQLKIALNQVWGIAPAPKNGFLAFIRTRGLAILMVMGIGFLLLGALATTTALAILNRQVSEFLPGTGPVLPVLNAVVTLLIVTLSFAIIFKTLPDAVVAWRDVLLGAFVTALLFGIGQYAIGFYLSTSSVGSAFGAASSLVVLLFWIYISAQILMLGAEFTQVYANNYGSRVRPADNALVLQRTAVEPEQPAHPPMLPARAAPPREPLPATTAWRLPAALGLLGLAAGLFLGYVGSLLRGR